MRTFPCLRPRWIAATCLLPAALLIALALPARAVGPFETVIAPVGAPNDLIGYSMAAVGDVNNDGCDDFLVGLPMSDLTYYGSGAAYLYFGGPTYDAVPDLVMGAEASGDEFGDCVAAGGDLNGDGHRDFVIGAHYNDEVAYDVGKVYVYFGGPAMDTVADLMLLGYASSGQFGHTLAGPGDLNGDGYDDLAVGAAFDATGGGGGGRVYIYLGGPGFDATPDLTLIPSSSGGGFGYSMDSGELTGDGWPDLVVGDFQDNSGGTNSGRVYVFAGGPSLDGTPELVVTGEALEQLGWHVGLLGDVDADGDPDLGVASVRWYGWYADRARVYVFRGGAALDGTADLVIEDTTNPLAFGVGVQGLGDLTGDGYDDFVAGNNHIDAFGGRVYLFAGGPALDTTADHVFIGPDAGGQYCLCIAPAGDFNGDGRQEFAIAAPYSTVGGTYAGHFWIYALPGTTVRPEPPTTCITPSHACVDVPVTIDRVDATPLRGFSVEIALSSGLALCPPEIEEGDYLNGGGGGGGRPTHFEVIEQGGGVYTVDCAILGGSCGATDLTGTLFTLHVASGLPAGSGTVTVSDVITRDCDNAPVDAAPGPPAVLIIDNGIPDGIAVLAAAQQKSGNDADGTTQIVVSWPPVEPGTMVRVYRAGYGNHPEYDDPPGAGAVPPIPAYPPAGAWLPAGTVAAPGTSLIDEVGNRDFWFYVAFVEDSCGNVSVVSNRTGGTLNYHLGDTHNGSANCAGDNLVNTSDISFLGAHYGATLGPADTLGCLDVGPTTDSSVDARPTTDNRLQFEDLMMFAINHEEVSAPRSFPAAGDAADRLTLLAPEAAAEGEYIAVALRFEGAGRVRGLSAQLGWDPARCEPVGWNSGGMAEEQGGVVLSAAPGNIDAAIVAAPTGFQGEGILATWTFRALAGGPVGITLAGIEARDSANRQIDLPVSGVVPELPVQTTLGLATPNPFRDRAEFVLSLSAPVRVELAVYSVDGRRVRTVASGNYPAGRYPLTWDGRDDLGRFVSPGLYWARLVTPEGIMSRRMAFVR